MQGVLFKVHRYFLQRDSDTFGREFGGAEAEAGRSDVTAFVFSNLDKEEFVALLDFYYYGYVSMRALYPCPMASKAAIECLLILSRPPPRSGSGSYLYLLDSLSPISVNEPFLNCITTILLTPWR